MFLNEREVTTFLKNNQLCVGQSRVEALSPRRRLRDPVVSSRHDWRRHCDLTQATQNIESRQAHAHTLIKALCAVLDSIVHLFTHFWIVRIEIQRQDGCQKLLKTSIISYWRREPRDDGLNLLRRTSRLSISHNHILII